MEASDLAESSKRQKMFVGHSTDENEDRISHLPEHILHFILSFLPTKFAVGTSVLSTRWKFLWTSIHNLDFCDELYFSMVTTRKEYLKRKRPFINFVDRVLFLQEQNVSNVHKFSLSCQECDAAHFNKWVSNAIKRNVQELILSVLEELPFMIPRCLFACDSLKILKIKMTVSVQIPSSICFSLLKVLHLKFITFSSDQSIQEVSLSCPILEEFVIYFCTWLKMKTVNIFVPALQKLTIDCRGSGELHDCEIIIDAGSLRSLKLEGGTSYKYSLCHLSSLVDVSFGFFPHGANPNGTIVHRLGSLLRGIYNVRHLELNAESIQTLSFPAFSAHMLSLSHLIHLRVVDGSYMSGKRFVDLLCNMPNIETLLLPDGLGSFGFSGAGRILGTTPKCFLSHLKLVDIKCFRGIKNEIWFVKFLIKSVRATDKLTIRLMKGRFESPNKEWKDCISRELAMHLNGSNCVLEFG